MGDKDLSYQPLTSGVIYKVRQHEFNMEELTVSPKHAKTPKNEYDCRGISGIKAKENPFKVSNISKTRYTREIVPVASWQTKKKGKNRP